MNRSANISGSRGLAYAVAGFCVTRIIVLVVACTAPQDRTRPDAPQWWSDVPLIRWDSGHYAYIMLHGYPPPVDGGLPRAPRSDTIAFFPGYPLLARLTSAWLDCEHALLLTSHVAALIGILFLYAWSCRHAEPRPAVWCIWLLSAYPPAMFLSAGYADAVLLMCTAIALWLLEPPSAGLHGTPRHTGSDSLLARVPGALKRRLDAARLPAAACISGLATATRPTGLAIAVIVTLRAWTHGRRGRGRLARVLLIGTISVSGLLAYQAYLWHRYGRPDAFLAVQVNWAPGKAVPDPIVRILTLKPVLQPAIQPFKHALRGEFRQLLDPPIWNPLFNVLILVLGIAGLARPGTVPRAMFLLPILVFLQAYVPEPYRGGRLIGIARYQLAALPCFLLLARWAVARWPWVIRYVLVALLMLLQCLYVRGFVNWELVG